MRNHEVYRRPVAMAARCLANRDQPFLPSPDDNLGSVAMAARCLANRDMAILRGRLPPAGWEVAMAARCLANRDDQLKTHPAIHSKILGRHGSSMPCKSRRHHVAAGAPRDRRVAMAARCLANRDLLNERVIALAFAWVAMAARCLSNRDAVACIAIQKELHLSPWQLDAFQIETESSTARPAAHFCRRHGSSMPCKSRRARRRRAPAHRPRRHGSSMPCKSRQRPFGIAPRVAAFPCRHGSSMPFKSRPSLELEQDFPCVRVAMAASRIRAFSRKPLRRCATGILSSCMYCALFPNNCARFGL